MIQLKGGEDSLEIFGRFLASIGENPGNFGLLPAYVAESGETWPPHGKTNPGVSRWARNIHFRGSFYLTPLCRSIPHLCRITSRLAPLHCHRLVSLHVTCHVL